MNKTEQLSTSTQKPKIELPNKELVGVKPTEKKEINESSKLPSPTGWRILVLPYRGKGKTEGGVLMPESAVEQQQVSTQVGYVLKVGSLAYKDSEKFPTGPWCQEKDWVMFARYSGSRFNIDGGEVRILNDDEILAKISDPEDVLHY